MSLVLIAIFALPGVLAVVFGVRYRSKIGLVLGIVALVAAALGITIPPSERIFSFVLLGALAAGITGLVLAVYGRPKPAAVDPAEAEGPVKVAETMVIDPTAVVSTGPNVFAVLGLVFGLLGGWLGIVFGFVGLSQIKRTGQSGRGLAIAGIVLAFAWIAAYGTLVAVGLSR